MLLSNQTSLMHALLNKDLSESLNLVDQMDDFNFSLQMKNPKAVFGHLPVPNPERQRLLDAINLKKSLRTVSPLHLACEIPGAEKLVALMLAKGAKADVADENGKTPLHYAQENDHFAAAELLLQHQPELRYVGDNKKMTPIHFAAQMNKVKFLELYLQKFTIAEKTYSCDIEVKNEGDETPLHIAALWGNKEVVLKLIKYGANIHARDDGNCLPADYARGLHPEVYRILNDSLFPSLFLLTAKMLHETQENVDGIPDEIREQAGRMLTSYYDNRKNTEEKEALLNAKRKADAQVYFSKLPKDHTEKSKARLDEYYAWKLQNLKIK